MQRIIVVIIGVCFIVSTVVCGGCNSALQNSALHNSPLHKALQNSSLFSYQVGTKTLFGEDVRTVYVPIFKTDGTRRDLGEMLTEAVCKRIESRSPYKVVSKVSADSVLEGEIVNRSKGVLITAPSDDPRQISMTMAVNVRWKDRRDRNIREFGDMPLDISWNNTDGMVNSTASLIPEYGQSEMTSEQRQIEAVADQIVGMMEMPW
jgi:hypothetical protein